MSLYDETYLLRRRGKQEQELFDLNMHLKSFKFYKQKKLEEVPPTPD